MDRYQQLLSTNWYSSIFPERNLLDIEIYPKDWKNYQHIAYIAENGELNSLNYQRWTNFQKYELIVLLSLHIEVDLASPIWIKWDRLIYLGDYLDLELVNDEFFLKAESFLLLLRNLIREKNYFYIPKSLFSDNVKNFTLSKDTIYKTKTDKRRTK